MSNENVTNLKNAINELDQVLDKQTDMFVDNFVQLLIRRMKQEPARNFWRILLCDTVKSEPSSCCKLVARIEPKNVVQSDAAVALIKLKIKNVVEQAGLFCRFDCEYAKWMPKSLVQLEIIVTRDYENNCTNCKKQNCTYDEVGCVPWSD